MDIAGGLDGGAMVLTGTIADLDSGEVFAFRGTWTPLPDGRMRQLLEEAREPGRWRPWFDGIYERAATAEEAPPD